MTRASRPMARCVAAPRLSPSAIGCFINASAARPCPVHAVCLLQRAPSLSLDVEVLASNPLSIAPYMLGLPDAGGGERARFELYSQLASSAVLLRVSAGEHDSPSAIAARLRGELSTGRPEPVAVLA